MTICILGRQPAIALAELEALYGADAVRPIGGGTAMVDADIHFKRLGGTQKAGTVLTTIPGTNPQKAFQWLQENLSSHIEPVEGKLKLGVSLYGLAMPVPRINANALSLKKAMKQNGQSVRIVPNTESALSSAQTYHNNLTDKKGCEIMLVRDGDMTIVARVTDIQGIDAYRKRDQERPHRDTFVGMLPPKLAQTIVNLAVFTLDEDRNKPAKATDAPLTILDPFCGTGVILQEASLMGFHLYGTDLNEKMIRYTTGNMAWLFERYPIQPQVRYEAADATNHTWSKPFDVIACEGYLGHPFASEPSREALMETVQTCNVIMRKFLKNIGSQVTPGTRFCIAAPAWYYKGKFEHLPVLSELEAMGYSRIDFVHAKRDEMIYHREGQVTGRELIVLTKS